MSSARRSPKSRRVPWGAAEFALTFASLGLCLSCARGPAEGRLPTAEALAVLRGYADVAYAAYSDSAQAARLLLAATEGFVNTPSEEGLARARKAWRAARIPYSQT